MAHISQPNLHLPEVHMPDVKLPDLHVGDLRLPDFKAPDIDFQALTRLGRPEPKRRSLLPWVVLGGVAAAAGGFVLATSSATAPRIRAAATRLRTRVQAWRNGASDWDEETEASTEKFWATEDGWRQEGSHAGAGSPADALEGTMPAPDSTVG